MRSNYDLPIGSYVQLASQVAVVRTLWHSARHRRPIVLGRNSRLHVARGARLRVKRGGLLAIGLSPIGSAGASVELRPRATLEIDGFVQLMRGARIEINWDGHATVGAGTYFNERALLDCGERVVIGADCAIGRDTAIMDTDVHRIVTEDGTRTNPVSLGSRCWLGHRATVLKGVTLGDGCVVAAGAIVTRDSGPGRLLRGIPAKDAGPVTWALI